MLQLYCSAVFSGRFCAGTEIFADITAATTKTAVNYGVKLVAFATIIVGTHDNVYGLLKQL